METAGDEALRGDFDGDGKMDAAVYRASDNIWYILQSSNNQPRYEKWGSAADRRLSRDYDGDGKTDFAVWRNGIFSVLYSSTNVPVTVEFGTSNDMPVDSAFVRDTPVTTGFDPF